MPLSTVGAVLSRHGLGKLPRLRPEALANSYERPRPGELVHLDKKLKLGRIGRPYRPRTNGKAERFIRTLVDGWAYGAVHRTSAERTAALAG